MAHLARRQIYLGCGEHEELSGKKRAVGHNNLTANAYEHSKSCVGSVLADR